MRAGTLNRRIIIKSKGTPTKSVYGSEVITWATVTTVWASIAQATGREAVEAQQAQAFLSWRIRLRHQPSVTIAPAMRVYYGSRIFHIEDVALSLNERRRETVLSCTEIVDE